jgi:CRISPR/Cas system-associated exonuclease Cas4 (RecB family)
MYILLLGTLIAIALLYGSLRRKRKTAGLQGWVESQDLDGKSPRIYRDLRNGISAKPDIVERNKVIEVKTASIGDKARRTDILQLTAGMMAAGAKKAELWYGNDKRFEFSTKTPIIQQSMKRIVWITEQMKWHLLQRSAPKGNPRPAKCVKCTYRSVCPDAAKVGYH